VSSIAWVVVVIVETAGVAERPTVSEIALVCWSAPFAVVPVNVRVSEIS